MKVRHTNGRTVINVPVGKAKRLVATGSWLFEDPQTEVTAETVKAQLEITDPSTAEVAREALEVEPEGKDTPEEVEDVPEASQPQEQPTKKVASIAEMRKWALDQGIEGVKEKGKLCRPAIDAYLEAHKD